MRLYALAAATLVGAALSFPLAAHASVPLAASASVPLAAKADVAPVTGEVCEDATGTTVVVDFTDLGGDVEAGCAADSVGMTGLQALDAAGFEVTPVETGGLTAICRIDDQPSGSEALTVEGQDYTEACEEFPPAGAYWSYYVAEDGGAWEYAQTGADASEVVPGGYEGWRFQLNQSLESAPNPAFDPANPPTPTAPESDEDAEASGDSGDDGVSPVVWVVVGAGVVVVIGLGVAASRRRSSEDG
ncbi:hypothetical protein CLV56_2311 [Mumia flava]|uniref:Uncharacterized protein n=1 Tax=Mumia flava TaxID=1348852 RepID=A0A2M9BJE0_9ACTN|nr:hypothetical protein [Mumia flava]PJJ58066.1 hypothetical protein CLV56_2311 [Mumia flava]